MDEDDAKRQGLEPGTAPPERMYEYTNARTGEIQMIPEGVDPPFNYPPGGRLESLNKMLTDKIEALPADLRAAVNDVPNYVGAVSATFQTSVREGMDTVPSAVRQAAVEAGYSVTGGKTLLDIAPRLKTAPPPRGYGIGSTWENADGVTLWKEKIIAVAATTKLLDGTIDVTSPKRVGAVLRHEYGHVINGLLAASDTQEFKSAYATDVKSLLPWLEKVKNIDAKKELDYLLQADAAGRQETFADLFATLFGGGTTHYINPASAMPMTLDAVRAIISDFLKGKTR
jgi:hypothetical protein